MLSDLPLDSTSSGMPCLAAGASEVWDDAMKVISRKLSAQNYDLWFRPIVCQRVDGQNIYLTAPNQFIKEWFETHYQQVVMEVIHEGSTRPYVIHWQIDESSSQAESDADATVRKAKAAKASAPPSSPPTPIDSPPSRRNGAGGKSKPPIDSEPGQELLARYVFDSFVIGPSNQLAAAASRAVADNPGGKYNPLFIYGGVGLGKTHLLHAIGHHIHAEHPSWRILYLKTETFMNEYINQVRSGRIDEFRVKYRDHTDVLLMDDIQYLGGKERTQDEFFHTFNALFESHRQIVVTADKYPHEIPDLEERIRSRFQWGLIADIQAPELETRVAILQKKAELDQIDLPTDVALFLATNIKSNVRELEGLLIRVAAFASLQQRPITIEFAQDTLRNFLTQSAAHLNVEAVQREVASYFGVKITDLKGQSRQTSVTRPRQVAMYLARKLCKASFPELGLKFGGKDHTTVMSACRKVEALLDSDPQLRGMVHEIERHLVA